MTGQSSDFVRVLGEAINRSRSRGWLNELMRNVLMVTFSADYGDQFSIFVLVSKLNPLAAVPA